MSQPSTSSATLPPSPATAPSLLDHTLRTAPISVIKGTAAFTALGGLTGSAFGVARNLPAIPAAFQTGIKTGVFSFTFFSVREYLINPALISFDLQPSPFLDPSTDAPSPHAHNLLPTAMSGFLAGTAFSAFTRSTIHGAPRAGVTLSLLTTCVQLLVNELGLARVHLLAWGEARRDRDALNPPPALGGIAPGQAAPPTYTRDISQKTPNVPSRETFSERSDRLIGSAWNWTWDRLGSLSPVKKIETEEYVTKLEARRREVAEERDKIQREMKQLEAARSAR